MAAEDFLTNATVKITIFSAAAKETALMISFRKELDEAVRTIKASGEFIEPSMEITEYDEVVGVVEDPDLKALYTVFFNRRKSIKTKTTVPFEDEASKILSDLLVSKFNLQCEVVPVTEENIRLRQECGTIGEIIIAEIHRLVAEDLWMPMYGLRKGWCIVMPIAANGKHRSNKTTIEPYLVNGPPAQA